MMKQIFASLLIMVSLISCEKDDDNIVTPESSSPTVKLNATYDVNITEDIIYAEGLSHDYWNSSNTTALPLYMDSYVPENNSQNRPLLMLIHGGAFVGGSKQQDAIVDMANYYASRGFVVFSIDYRLRDHMGTIPQAWIDATSVGTPSNLDQTFAMYPAHRDAKAALRWIMANAQNYHINKDYITVGGGSAGAITSIGIGVSELGDYKDEISSSEDNTLSTTQAPILTQTPQRSLRWSSR